MARCHVLHFKRVVQGYDDFLDVRITRNYEVKSTGNDVDVRRSWAFSLTEIKELLALRQSNHACSGVHSMLKRKLTDVRVKIKGLLHLEAELREAMRNCNRELRLKREIKHENCCPLLTKLDRTSGCNGNKYVASGRPGTK